MTRRPGRVGVGIISHNRRAVFDATYRAIAAKLPDGADLVVVDDGSDSPIPGATHRNRTAKGVAGATNDALRLLGRCDHIFIFNDDVYPIVDEWWRPYVDSRHRHLCLSYERNAAGAQHALDVRVKQKRDDVWIYESALGLMMYMEHSVVKRIGGFDERFGTWGNEHRNFSIRAHQAGLTEHPFMDVPAAIDMFYSHDYHGTAESSVPEETRRFFSKRNSHLFARFGRQTYKVPLT